MKFLFACVLVFTKVFSFGQAAYSLPQKILFCNDSTKITIDVAIIKLVANTNNTIIYFIPKEDSAVNNFFDNTHIEYNQQLGLCNKVNIIFSCGAGVLAKNKKETLTNYLQKYLLDTLQKELPNLFVKNNLFYGINNGAAIALNMALQNAEKINKTAIFFNNYELTQLITTEIIGNAAKLKGKLFVYTNNEEQKLNKVDEIINELALKSNAMFYRIDAFNESIKNADTLGYSWLLADGNNIILKTDY